MKEAFGPPFNPIEIVDAYINEHLTYEKLQQELADRRSTFLLLENDNEDVIGFAKLRRHAPPRRLAERRALEIQRIYLLANQTGQGAGRYLMEYCLTIARLEAYKAVWLGVWEKNERATIFYQKAGFQPFGWHYFQFGPDRQRDIWMYKLI